MKKSPKTKSCSTELFTVSEKYWPDTIPRERTSLAKWLSTVVTIILFFGSALATWYNAKEELSFRKAVLITIEASNYGLITLFVAEIFHRIILLVVEFLHHFKSRYGGSYTKLVKYVFHFSGPVITLMVCSLLICLYFLMDHDVFELAKLDNWSILLLCASLFFLQKLIKVEDSPLNDSLKLGEPNGLNYGAGMACSFFYGYLKFVLAKNGQEDMSLTELIEIYCDSHGVKLPVSKLFILIPKSCICHDSLKTEMFPNIEESACLPEKYYTVAGVQNRVYKNSVYKIYDREKQKRIYVCAEYASPLKTFRVGLEKNGPYTEYYQNQAVEIVLQFYLRLDELLKGDHTVSNLCELIYYDDRDENGEFRDIAEILLAKVYKAKKKKQKCS